MFDFTFPYNQDLPTELLKRRITQLISLSIPFELGTPIVYIGFWNADRWAAVHVPEAAMDEDNRISTRKDQVRLPRQVFTMKPEAVAAAVDESPDE